MENSNREGILNTNSKHIFCAGVSCIEPPVPPNHTNLERTYVGGTTVPFGTGSNYTCKEGTFFGSDFGKTHIAIECYRNGSWEAPGLMENLHYKYGLLAFTI